MIVCKSFRKLEEAVNLEKGNEKLKLGYLEPLFQFNGVIGSLLEDFSFNNSDVR